MHLLVYEEAKQVSLISAAEAQIEDLNCLEQEGESSPPPWRATGKSSYEPRLAFLDDGHHVLPVDYCMKRKLLFVFIEKPFIFNIIWEQMASALD